MVAPGSRPDEPEWRIVVDLLHRSAREVRILAG
jgi:hypothetical protein